MNKKNLNSEIMPTPSFKEALQFWMKLGLVSFGGPAGQIAIMHRELVEEKKWVSLEWFLKSLNFCLLLPGPEAHQLAIYLGWSFHKSKGALAAGFFFILPSIFILWGLSLAYVWYGHTPLMGALIYGLKAAVIALVTQALWKLGNKTLHTPFLWGVALASFLLLFFLKVPFPLLILGAGLLGYSRHPSSLHIRWETQSTKNLLMGITVWLSPLLALGIFFGFSHWLVQLGLFFSKAALITFGGAYAVLPYVAQQAVEHYHWLSAIQMLDGLGFAETTPGPLIMVVQFVGFMAGWNQGPSPLALATLGSLMATWATFVPSFVFILTLAPLLLPLQENLSLQKALQTITATVVGVIANLGMWFAIHAFLTPQGIEGKLIFLTVLNFIFLSWRKWGVFQIIGFSLAAGFLSKAIF